MRGESTTTTLTPDQQASPIIPEKKTVWTRWWMVVLYFVAGIPAAAIVTLVAVQIAGSEVSETFDEIASELETPAVEEPSTELATPVVPEGYVLFDGSEYGFTIAHPSRWVPLDRRVDREDAFEQALESGVDPDAVELFAELYERMLEWGVDTQNDLTITDPFTGDNLGVNSWPSEPGLSLDYYEASNQELLEQVPGLQVLSISRVKVAGLESLRTAYRIEGSEEIAEGYEYLVLTTDDNLYQIVFTVFDPDESDRDTVVTTIDTFTVINRLTHV